MSKFYLLNNKYLEYLKAIGINGELAFKKAEIPIKALSKKDIFISREQYINLMNVLDEITDDKSFLNYSNIDNMLCLYHHYLLVCVQKMVLNVLK